MLLRASMRLSIRLLPLLAMFMAIINPSILPATGAPNRATIVAKDWFVRSPATKSSAAAYSWRERNGYRTETYDSAVRNAYVHFNAIAPSWNIELTEGSVVRIFVRSRNHDGNWSQWASLQPDDNDGMNSGTNYGALVVQRGDEAQLRVQLVGKVGGQMPKLNWIRLTFIDSENGPNPANMSASRSGVAMAAEPKPRIITRAEWGADESLRFDSQGHEIWPRQYTTPRKVILHDTVTINNDPNPAATIRAIYYYHAVIRGWGDIGYNYLVDEQGNIYEGRAGGENVVGGHARCYNWGTVGIATLGDHSLMPPSSKMVGALEDLIAWIFSKNHINPLGHGSLGSYAPYDIPNIATHYDLMGSCGNTHRDPGYYLRRLLPQIRRDIAIRLGYIKGSTISNDTGSSSNNSSRTPKAWGPGLTYEVVNTRGTGLNLRARPDDRSPILAILPDGTIVQEIPSPIDGWVKTTYKGKTGYLWHGYLKVIPPAEPSNPSSTSVNKEPTYVVTAPAVNLRAGPGMKYKVLRTVPKGAVIQEITSKVDGWVKTVYGGYTGYIWYENLRVIRRPDSAPASGGSGGSGSNSSFAQTNPVQAYIRGTPGALNLRKGPGMQYQVVTKMWEGMPVQIIGKSVNGWVPVIYKDGFGRSFQGWAWGEYISTDRSARATAGALGLAGAAILPALRFRKWRKRK